MALENITDMINPLTGDFWSNLPPEILAPFERLITILQIVGIVVLIYFIFLLIRGILNWRRNKRIDITYKKVLEIDKKLDELLSRTPKKEKILEKKEKKTGFFARLFGKKEESEKKVKEKIRITDINNSLFIEEEYLLVQIFVGLLILKINLAT